MFFIPCFWRGCSTHDTFLYLAFEQDEHHDIAPFYVLLLGRACAIFLPFVERGNFVKRKMSFVRAIDNVYPAPCYSLSLG